MQLHDKTVLVTGGAVRIGRALCLACAKAGAKLIVHYNQSEPQAQSLLLDLNEYGTGHALIQADLASPEEVEVLAEPITQADILINNASIFAAAPREQESDEAVARQMQINYHAPLRLMQLLKQNSSEACIINFLDQRVICPDPNQGSYLASKVSLRDATTRYAREWAPTIRVNAIAPGPVLPPVGLNGPGMQKILADVPMGEQVAMDNITNACLFLISNDSITGQILYVDGGQHLNTAAEAP